VSRVVSGKAVVSKATRERVMRAIELLDYRPNLFARGLGGARSHTIGLVYNNPNAYLVVAALEGAIAACDALSFALHIHPFDSMDAALGDKLLRFASSNGLAGLVLTPPISEREIAIATLTARGMACVRVLSTSEDPDGPVPCIYIDDRQAAYAITEHLVQLGHRRIGFLKGGTQHHASTERFEGYLQALRDYGITLRPELVIEGDYVFSDGFRGARRLFSLPAPPTAIFGSNDEIAAGALAAMRSDGLQVPHDVSIAGFEDSPFSRHSWPPLTTARQPAELIVEEATKLLIAYLREGSVKNIGFKPELVVRGSTAPPERSHMRRS
jgi:LacI family transcriptional regulator